MSELTLPIRIVLLETSHPGNIGAVARAMKNMGLSELHLVRPREFPHADATARASGADDVLNTAVMHDNVAAAIVDCGLVFGTSARQRHIPFTPIQPRECASLAVAKAREGNRVAILFGNERTGLQNAELALCNSMVTIPTSDSYSSLNIAMAVQIVAYELLLARYVDADAGIAQNELLATSEELERFYIHLSQVLEGTHFRDHSNSGHLMMRMRRIFNRTHLAQDEIRILRGMLSAIHARKADEPT